MAGKNRNFAIILILLVALALVALNPNSEDFRSWLSAQQRSSATKTAEESGLGPSLSSGAGAIVSALTELTSSSYGRTNIGLFSIYSTSAKNAPVYLGIARLFFRLK